MKRPLMMAVIPVMALLMASPVFGPLDVNGRVLALNTGQGGHCTPPTPDVKAIEQLPAPPLMTGIGRASFIITTKSAKAQQYFNQGVALFQCFWWNEALRAFQEAARLDPDCAMPHWGIYQVLANPWSDGAPTEEKATVVKKAGALSAKMSPREQAYIHAVEVRETLGGEAGRVAYVKAMQTLIEKYPNDFQAKLFLAVFLFQDNFPLGFDPLSGQPSENRKHCIALLREVLREHPNNAAANHFWIHAVEGGPDPQSALASAIKLGTLSPASGHMVHMPGHIYFRLGNYEQARRCFLHSMKVETAYMEANQVKPEQLWNYTHNMAYLTMNCAEDGRYQEGLKWAGLGGVQADPSTLNIRYGFWDKAAQSLADPAAAAALENAPPPVKTYHRGWLAFATGMASVAEGNPDAASRQAEVLDQALAQVKTELAGEAVPYGFEFLPKILATASLELRGSIQSAAGDHVGAVALLKQAVEKEKEVGYEEPPPYPRPVLESLGQAYLRAKEWKLAREAFQEELKRRPKSGHAFFGIAQSYDLAGQPQAAARAYRVFLNHWRSADPDLPQVKIAKQKARWH